MSKNSNFYKNKKYHLCLLTEFLICDIIIENLRKELVMNCFNASQINILRGASVEKSLPTVFEFSVQGIFIPFFKNKSFIYGLC